MTVHVILFDINQVEINIAQSSFLVIKDYGWLIFSLYIFTKGNNFIAHFLWLRRRVWRYQRGNKNP